MKRLYRNDVHRRFPFLKGYDITGGLYHAKDAYITDQMEFMHELRKYSEAHDTIVCCNTRVTEMKKILGGGIHINTDNRGELSAEKVIIAAGAQSPELAKLLGYDLPLSYSTRTLFSGRTAGKNQGNVPIVEFIDGSKDEGFYFRPPEINGRQFLLAVGPTIDTSYYPEEVSSFGADDAKTFLENRLPDLEVGDLNGNPGVRTMTGDGLPYVGPLDSNTFVAYGGSGYGFTLMPPLSEVATDLLLGVEGGIRGEFQKILNPERGLHRPHRSVEGL